MRHSKRRKGNDPFASRGNFRAYVGPEEWERSRKRAIPRPLSVDAEVGSKVMEGAPRPTKGMTSGTAAQTNGGDKEDQNIAK